VIFKFKAFFNTFPASKQAEIVDLDGDFGVVGKQPDKLLFFPMF
jgi:hypothetical protein